MYRLRYNLGVYMVPREKLDLSTQNSVQEKCHTIFRSEYGCRCDRTSSYDGVSLNCDGEGSVLFQTCHSQRGVGSALSWDIHDSLFCVSLRSLVGECVTSQQTVEVRIGRSVPCDVNGAWCHC